MTRILKIHRTGLACGAALLVSMFLGACGTSSVAPTAQESAAIVSASAGASVIASGPTTTAGPTATAGPASPAGTPTFSPDACATLVTKEEVEAAVGGTVGKLEVNGKSDAIVGIPPYGGSLCWYPITNGIFVQLTVGQAPDPASLAGALTNYKAKNPGTEVDGLGDAAYASDDGLMVIEGSRLAVVTIYSTEMDRAASDAAQISLAKRILERW